MLKDKNIVLGVTGGIAVYKSAYLVRELVKRGAKVKVVMTPMAKEFVGTLTFATLSKNPVLCDFYDKNNGQWFSHVDLGLWADAFVIAPATANTLAKMAHGIADNLLLTVYLSMRAPVFVAPAMDYDMFLHPATQENIQILRQRGNHIIEPPSGELASGLVGRGRMEEPDKIAGYLEKFFSQKQDFVGKKVLITAGPTYEMIDPVRFIGNFSSGKMGYALAEEFASRGAEVTLISGEVNLTAEHPNIKTIKIRSAEEMYREAKNIFPLSDIAILAAAVADYKPKTMATSKIKKSNDNLVIELVKNPDIAKELGKIKKQGQITVGFALETDNEESNALEKLRKKNFDFIVLNSLKDEGAGFGTDTNKITIIDKKGDKHFYDLKPKKEVAKDIADFILKNKTELY